MGWFEKNEIIENINTVNKSRDKTYPKAFDGERNPKYWCSYDHKDGTRVIVQEVKSKKKYKYLLGMYPTEDEICNSADVLFIKGENYIHFNLRQKELDTVDKGSLLTIKRYDKNDNVEDIYSSETKLHIFKGANDIKKVLKGELKMYYDKYLPGDIFDLQEAINSFKEMKRNEKDMNKIITKSLESGKGR